MSLAWVTGTIGANTFGNVVFGNGMWVAVGADTFYSSPDGKTWTPHAAPNGVSDYSNIVYGALGGFLAIAADAMSVSHDGLVWTECQSGRIGGGAWTREMCAAASPSIYSVWDRDGLNYWSADGYAWTAGTHYLTYPPIFMQAHGGSYFLMQQTNAGTQRSLDGVAFTQAGDSNADVSASNLSTSAVLGRFVTMVHSTIGSGKSGCVSADNGLTWQDFTAEWPGDSGFQNPSGWTDDGTTAYCILGGTIGPGGQGATTAKVLCSTKDFINFSFEVIPDAPVAKPDGYSALAYGTPGLLAITGNGGYAFAASGAAPAPKFWERLKLTREML